MLRRRKSCIVGNGICMLFIIAVSCVVGSSVHAFNLSTGESIVFVYDLSALVPGAPWDEIALWHRSAPHWIGREWMNWNCRCL